MSRRRARALVVALSLLSAVLLCLTAGACSREEPARASRGKVAPNTGTTPAAETSPPSSTTATPPTTTASPVEQALRTQARAALEADDATDRIAFARTHAPPPRAGMYRGGLAAMTTALETPSPETRLELARLYELTAPDLVAMPVAAALAEHVAANQDASPELAARATALEARYRKAAASSSEPRRLPRLAARAEVVQPRKQPRTDRVSPTLPCKGGDCQKPTRTRRAPIIEKRSSPTADGRRAPTSRGEAAAASDGLQDIQWVEPSPRVTRVDVGASRYRLALNRGLILEVPLTWPIDGPLPSRDGDALHMLLEVLVPQLPATAEAPLQFERLRFSQAWRPNAVRPGDDGLASARTTHAALAEQLCKGLSSRPSVAPTAARGLDVIEVSAFSRDCAAVTVRLPGNQFVTVGGHGLDAAGLVAHVTQLLATDKAAP